MQIVTTCDALGITYLEYVKMPKWWVELMIRKRVADKEAAKTT